MADSVTERVKQQIDHLRDTDWEQYTLQEEDTSSLSFFSGLLLGLFVGALIAVLLAPQPGSSTREQVKQTGIELLPGSDNNGDEAES